MNASSALVSVVLSTYNGETYLSEQLRSILDQSRAPDILLIRDDGSSDSTIELLQTFSFPENVQVKVIRGKNIGVRESFFAGLEALEDTPDQVIFFADQDDVWLPEKIEKTLLGFKGGEVPQLVSCRYIAWSEGNDTFLKEPPLRFKPHADDSLLQNLMPGCTMAINEKLRKLILQSRSNFDLLDPDILHDWIAYILAAQFGRVDFLSEHLIHYRQHANNQIGSPLRGFKRYVATLKKFLTLKIYRYVLRNCRMVLSIRGSCSEVGSFSDSKRIKALASLLEGRLLSLISLLRNGLPRRQSLLGSLLFYIGMPLFWVYQTFQISRSQK